MATREVLCKKNMDLKSMQENVRKSVARLTKNGFDMKTD